jgi:hypothetical protein
MTIKGFTIKEMADEIGITYEAAQKRIERAGIKPILKEDVYPESTLDIIRDSPGPGRPPKAKPEVAAPDKPAKKPRKQPKVRPGASDN